MMMPKTILSMMIPTKKKELVDNVALRQLVDRADPLVIQVVGEAAAVPHPEVQHHEAAPGEGLALAVLEVVVVLVEEPERKDVHHKYHEQPRRHQRGKVLRHGVDDVPTVCILGDEVEEEDR